MVVYCSFLSDISFVQVKAGEPFMFECPNESNEPVSWKKRIGPHQGLESRTICRKKNAREHCLVEDIKITQTQLYDSNMYQCSADRPIVTVYLDVKAGDAKWRFIDFD